MKTAVDPWPEILNLVAHQLRVPTAMIAGYVDLLTSDEIRRDVDRTRRILNEVRSSVREINRLTVELQDATRTALGTLPIRFERVSVGSLIDESIRSAAPLCELRSVTLERFVSSGANGYLKGDPYYLKTCLVNLIDNAAKYGKPGGRVQVVAESVRTMIELRVSDEGSGLGPNGEELFAPFAQGARAQQGIGLGLTLVKAIVEAHDGQMVWKSGEGSYVGFRLPHRGN